MLLALAALATAAARSKPAPNVHADGATANDLAIEVVDTFGGPAGAMALGDRCLFLAKGGDIAVVDISDPHRLAFIGEALLWPGSAPLAVVTMVRSGDRLYVASRETAGRPSRLLVFTGAEACQPRQVGALVLQNRPTDVVVNGEIVYLGLVGAAGQAVDVRDPTQPVAVAELPLTAATSSLRLALVGGTLVAAGWTVPVRLFDVTNPARPLPVADLAHKAANVVALPGGYGLLKSDERLEILDLSDPRRPVVRGSLPTTPGGRLAVDEHWIYLWGSYAIERYAMAGSTLRHVETLAMPASDVSPSGDTPLPDIVFDGNRVFVSHQLFGLVSADLSAPPTMQRTAELPWTTTFLAVETDGRHVFAFTRSYAALQVLDVRRAGSIRVVATVPVTSYTMALAGSRLILVTRAEDDVARRLEVWDVADAARPLRAGTVDLPAAVHVLAVTGDRVLAAGFELDLTVVDLRDPAAPRILGSLAPHGHPGTSSVAAAGDVAFVTSEDLRQIVAVDLADPAQPRRIGSLRLQEAAEVQALALRGSILHAALSFDDPSGLALVDVRDPTRMTELGSVLVSGVITALDVIGHAAVLGLGYGGLRVIDVADPRQPRDIGGTDAVSWIGYVAVADCRIYFSNSELGLAIGALVPSRSPDPRPAATRAWTATAAVFLPYVEQAPACLLGGSAVSE